MLQIVQQSSKVHSRKINNTLEGKKKKRKKLDGDKNENHSLYFFSCDLCTELRTSCVLSVIPKTQFVFTADRVLFTHSKHSINELSFSFLFQSVKVSSLIFFLNNQLIPQHHNKGKAEKTFDHDPR